MNKKIFFPLIFCFGIIFSNLNSEYKPLAITYGIVSTVCAAAFANFAKNKFVENDETKGGILTADAIYCLYSMFLSVLMYNKTTKSSFYKNNGYMGLSAGVLFALFYAHNLFKKEEEVTNELKIESTALSVIHTFLAGASAFLMF